MNIHWGLFIFSFAFVFSTNGQSRHLVKVISRIFAWSAYQQIFFFVNQRLSFIFAHLEVRRKLNGISRTCLLAKTAENAPREVDAKEFRITPAMLIFCGLQRYAIHGTGRSAEVTGYAPLPAIRITRQDDPSSPSWRYIRLFFGIEYGLPLSKGVQQYRPDGFEQGQSKHSSAAGRQHYSTSHKQVHKSQRQHHLPAEGH